MSGNHQSVNANPNCSKKRHHAYKKEDGAFGKELVVLWCVGIHKVSGVYVVCGWCDYDLDHRVKLCKSLRE